MSYINGMVSHVHRCWKCKGPRKAATILKKNKVELTFPNLKIYYKASVRINRWDNGIIGRY
jgi:hypothetical protein